MLLDILREFTISASILKPLGSSVVKQNKTLFNMVSYNIANLLDHGIYSCFCFGWLNTCCYHVLENAPPGVR